MGSAAASQLWFAGGWPAVIDRFFGQFDWGALPRHLVEDSIHRLATEIAPAVRATPPQPA